MTGRKTASTDEIIAILDSIRNILDHMYRYGIGKGYRYDQEVLEEAKLNPGVSGEGDSS